MNRTRIAAGILCVIAMVGGSGCMIRLGPKQVELKRPTQPPILRLGTITEELTGGWAPLAKAQSLGGKNVLVQVLRESEAAALFSNDPANLTVDVHLTSFGHDLSGPLTMLGTLSIVSLGLVPLPFHAEWQSSVNVTVKTPDDVSVAERAFTVKGTYDILALPPTMFTLGAASLRGMDDARRVARRMTDYGVAEMMAWVETERPRLAKWREAWVVAAEQQPLSAQVGATTYWVVYNIVAVKEGARHRRQYTLGIHRSRPRKGAAPLRTLVLGEAASSPGAPWRWRDPESIVLYAERGLWYPEWKVKNPHDQLASVRFQQRKVLAAELLGPGAFPKLSPGDLNGYLIDWKNRELAAALREASARELQDHVGRIEHAILKANEAAEAEKDKAQQLAAAGKSGAESHTQAARVHISRIAILKPILAAIKAEIAGRQR